MEEPVTKTLFVPLQSMGRLIGKKGAGLVRLRRTSGIRNIEILPDTIDDTRQIEIKGKPATIEKATVYVMDLIGESLSEKVRPERTSSPSTSSTAEPTTQFRRCNLSHAFQSPHIEKALNIQRTIKVHWEHLDSNLSFESVVNTPGVEAMYIHVSPINGMRDVLLIGGSAPVQLALDTITERVLLEDTTGTHLEVSQERELSHYVRTKKTCSEAASFHSSAKISTLSIGKLIGKKGTNVQRIADVTGVDIIVYKQPSDDLREVHLFGDLKSVEKAESAIQRNVAGVRRDESRKDQPLEKTTKKIVSVPVACVGELIGRQGANLKILIQESGVKTVKVGREVTDGMRKVTIVGDPPNIDKVLKQLEKFTQVLDTTLGSSFDTQSKTEQLESLHWPDSPPREIQLSDNHLLHFLHAQSACLKCSVEEFYQWLQSEDIDTLKDLVEAFSDPDFVRKDMQDHGLKVRLFCLFTLWCLITNTTYRGTSGPSSKKPPRALFLRSAHHLSLTFLGS